MTVQEPSPAGFGIEEPGDRGPERARRLLQRLGPGFVKIGQFLALRPDLIPERYASEFFHLLDDVPPFPWRQAQAILQEDLGELARSFVHVEPRPLAAGSLAQVHLARLEDGAEVAVKILRPGIAERVESDIRRARILARLLGAAGYSFSDSPTAVVDEIADWLRREVDLSAELDNLRILHNLVGDSSTQFVPRPYPSLCSARIITLELVRGVRFTDIIALLDEGGVEALRERHPDIDPRRLGRHLMQATLEQMFRHRFFHADLHPGNLIALPGDVVGYVDFGLCEAMDEGVARDQARYVASVYDGDARRIAKTLLEIVVPGRDADAERLRAQVEADSRRWQERMRVERVRRPGRRAVRRTAAGNWLIDAIRAVRRNGFALPPGLLAAYRALLTAETVAARLSGRSQLRAVGRRFFSSLQIDDLLSGLSRDTVRRTVPRIMRLMQQAPEQIGEILSDLSAGRLELRVDMSEDSRSRRAADRRASMVTLAIISVGLAIMSTSPVLAPWPWARAAAFALLAVTYLMILRQWRNLR